MQKMSNVSLILEEILCVCRVSGAFTIGTHLAGRHHSMIIDSFGSGGRVIRPGPGSQVRGARGPRGMGGRQLDIALGGSSLGQRPPPPPIGTRGKLRPGERRCLALDLPTRAERALGKGPSLCQADPECMRNTGA